MAPQLLLVHKLGNTDCRHGVSKSKLTTSRLVGEGSSHKPFTTLKLLRKETHSSWLLPTETTNSPGSQVVHEEKIAGRWFH